MLWWLIDFFLGNSYVWRCGFLQWRNVSIKIFLKIGQLDHKTEWARAEFSGRTSLFFIFHQENDSKLKGTAQKVEITSAVAEQHPTSLSVGLYAVLAAHQHPTSLSVGLYAVPAAHQHPTSPSVGLYAVPAAHQHPTSLSVGLYAVLAAHQHPTWLSVGLHAVLAAEQHPSLSLSRHPIGAAANTTSLYVGDFTVAEAAHHFTLRRTVHSRCSRKSHYFTLCKALYSSWGRTLRHSIQTSLQ